MTQTKPEFEISLDDEEVAASLDEPDEGDDLPVLTDVVDERIEPYISESSNPIILEPINEAPAPEGEPASRLAVGQATDHLAERLVALDTAISRHIEEWVNNELPQLVSRELDDLAERLREAAGAHLRATLLPLLSAEIADKLDDDSQIG